MPPRVHVMAERIAEKQPLQVVEDPQVDYSRELSDADSTFGEEDRASISTSIKSTVTCFRH